MLGVERWNGLERDFKSVGLESLQSFIFNAGVFDTKDGRIAEISDDCKYGRDWRMA